MINVTILYFGQLRQAAATGEEQVRTPARTPGDLIEERAQLLGFAYHASTVRFARNESFCAADAPLADGDTVAFMPPMAGG